MTFTTVLASALALSAISLSSVTAIAMEPEVPYKTLSSTYPDSPPYPASQSDANPAFPPSWYYNPYTNGIAPSPNRSTGS